MKAKILEALLFSAYHPLTTADLAQVTGWQEAELEGLLAELFAAYAERGIKLRKVAGGYQLVTDAEAAPYITRLHKLEFSRTLSPAALETLAIIAYLQPLSRAKIEQLRGVKVGSLLKNLLKRKLVKIAGREKAPGQPPLYATTKEFLVHFGLNSLDDLPPLPEDEIPDFLKGSVNEAVG